MWPWYFQRFQIRKRHPCSSLSASANDEMMRFNHYFNSLLMFVTFQNKTEVIQARERRHLAKITLACIRARSHETSHLLLLILQIWSGRSDWADLLLLFVLTGRWISLLHLITAETITEEEAAFFFLALLFFSCSGYERWMKRKQGSCGESRDRWQHRLNVKWWRGGPCSSSRDGSPVTAPAGVPGNAKRAAGQADSWPGWQEALKTI